MQGYEKIRKMVKIYGFFDYELAAASGITHFTLSRWFREKPRAERVELLNVGLKKLIKKREQEVRKCI